MAVEPAFLRSSTLMKMNIAETNKPFSIKCYLNHFKGYANGCVRLVQSRSEICFPWQQIAPIRLKVRRRRHHAFSTAFTEFFLSLQVLMTYVKAWIKFEIWQYPTMNCGVSCPLEPKTF